MPKQHHVAAADGLVAVPSDSACHAMLIYTQDLALIWGLPNPLMPIIRQPMLKRWHIVQPNQTVPLTAHGYALHLLVLFL